MPAMVVAAQLKFLKPSIGPVRDLILRWSCSIKLFRYFDHRSLVSFHASSSPVISRTARCDTDRRALLGTKRRAEECLRCRDVSGWA